MCGICGIASARGTVDPGRIAAMSSTLVHRGPDSDGTYVDGPIGLAARRLAIIDLQTGDQPITREEHGVTVVQNGEIYNYAELRHQLQRDGHRFSTSGDTEVLIHLYAQHGDGFVERLRGMFALALWDSARSRLLLARDRYGIKPLYYRDVGGELEFASELRALPRGEIDLDALDAFLAFNSVPGPLTIFSDVRKLQPGHLLTWEDGRVAIARYARPAPVPADEVRDDEEAELVEELRARLRDSVRAHLVSDVPVGVLLSGGIDSAALAALAAQELSEPLRTFSIGFEERSFDELADARLVAERYGTDHHELVLRPDAALLLPALADAFDEPFADSSALPTYLVSQLAAQDVKVALSGEGGDELFGGYYTYAADLLAERAGWTAPLLRPVVERLPSSSARASFDYKAKRFVRAAHLPPLERHHGWKEIFSPDCARRADRARQRLRSRRRAASAVRGDRGRGAPRAAAGRRPRHVPRRRPAREDRPCVDGALARGARAVPRPGRDELLVRAPEPAQGARPQEEGPAAQGRGAADPARAAAAAQARLLDSRGRLASRRARAVRARDALGRHACAARASSGPTTVTRLLDDHVAGREDLSRQLWGLLTFTLWHERHVERTPGPLAEPRLEALVE